MDLLKFVFSVFSFNYTLKKNFLDSKIGMESLVVVPCSKSSAEQRAGRAGRLRPGQCFRLYPEVEFKKLSSFTIPEIQRGDLSSVILRLKALGVQNVLRFLFFIY